MAATTINYRGLSGVRATINVDTTDTLTSICSTAITDEGLNANYYQDFVLLRDGEVKRSAVGTLSFTVLGLTSSDTLVAILDDDPATWTKQQRQVRKLEIASIKRAADSRRSTYDITQLPDTYNNNAPGADDNPNVGGLVTGRPWT